MIRIHTNEKGMVSITVTVILMLVISITVLSFAQIIRREQRQSLDNQLSSQAFYAAESGINQARKYIADKWLANGEIPKDKEECGYDADYPEFETTKTIDATTNTKFTCLLVLGSPKSLKYDLSPSAGSKVFPVFAQNGTVSRLDVSWTPSTTNAPRTGCASSGAAPVELPRAGNWPCRGYGLIRIDLVPADDMTRQGMMRNMFTAFLSPASPGSTSPLSFNGSGTNVHGGTANQGARAVASCGDSECKISINNMSSGRYYARVSTLYRETSLSVTAYNSVGNVIPLIGAQIVIDSTGRSQDVLRRVQVRVPLVSDGFHPDYGVQSTDSMCKVITTFPGYPMTGC